MLIIAIAFAAILRATNQDINSVQRVESKTIAHWVALQTLNSVQVGVTLLPPQDRSLSGMTQMLGRSWQWQCSVAPTLNKQN